MNRQAERHSGRHPVNSDPIDLLCARANKMPGGSCDDLDLLPAHLLLHRQGPHLRLNATCSRQVAVADMGNSHLVTVRQDRSLMTIPPPARTLVFVHAHPDDEALLTAGTMARAVAEGQRVVLIVATNGAAGLSSSEAGSELAELRSAELEASAQAIGVHRLVCLDYADSGLNGEVDGGFASIDRFTIAKRIAAVLDEESAGVLVGYDPAGGYGHP
ncbi:MAG TPA: hypothetical protein DDY88_04855, partial [Actinobacteria bacterium]|nr:hypothetical protein [Actinomycetota bacterium]